jgi:hypothetical protein
MSTSEIICLAVVALITVLLITPFRNTEEDEDD